MMGAVVGGLGGTTESESTLLLRTRTFVRTCMCVRACVRVCYVCACVCIEWICLWVGTVGEEVEGIPLSCHRRRGWWCGRRVYVDILHKGQMTKELKIQGGRDGLLWLLRVYCNG